jgi:hypothetical protein
VAPGVENTQGLEIITALAEEFKKTSGATPFKSLSLEVSLARSHSVFLAAFWLVILVLQA